MDSCAGDRVQVRGVAARTSEVYLQAVKGQKHSEGQFSLRRIVIVIVSEVSQKSFLCANSSGGRQCLVKTHMRWVRITAQRVEDGSLDATDLLHNFAGDFFAVAKIGQALTTLLFE